MKGDDWPVFKMQSDASFADDTSDRKSQGGYVGFWDDQPSTTWLSKKSSRTQRINLLSR